MIRPLRLRHRVMVCALGVVLPVAFVVGLVARRPVPVAASLPPGLGDKAGEFDQVLWTQQDLWPDQRICTSLRRNAAGASAVE